MTQFYLSTKMLISIAGFLFFTVGNISVQAQVKIQPAASPCDATPICGSDQSRDYVLLMKPVSGGAIPFPGFGQNCALHDPNWVAMVASDSTITLSIDTRNCQGGTASIQFAIYHGNPVCTNYKITGLDVIAGSCNCISGTHTYTMNSIPGEIYFMVIDGCAGALCDITLTIKNGLEAPPEVTQEVHPHEVDMPGYGPDTFCIGADLEFCADSLISGINFTLWTVNGSGDTVRSGIGSSCIPYDKIFKEHPATDSVKLCVAASNGCNSSAFNCRTYYIAHLEPIFENVGICEGEDYDWQLKDINTTELAQGTYTFSAYPDSVPGCLRKHILQLQVFPLPEAHAGINQVIPINTTTTLSASANGGSGDYSYTWTPTDKVVNPTDPNTATTALTETTDFTLITTDNATDCSDEDIVRITVTGGELGVDLRAILDTFIYCAGARTYMLEAVPTGGDGNYTFNWTTIPSGYTSNDDTVYVSPLDTTTYIVEVRDGGGLIARDSVTILVHSLPVADAGEDQFYCGNRSYLEICASGSDSAFYRWTLLSDSTIRVGRCTYLTEGTWSLRVESLNHCVNTDTINITRKEPIMVELFPDSTVIISGGNPPYDTSFLLLGNERLQVIVTDSLGCLGHNLIILTSTYKTPLPGVTVYPNPVTDILWIETGKIQEYKLVLFNQHGHRLLVKENVSRVDVSCFAPGVYYLQISTNQYGEYRMKRLPLVILR